MSTFQRHAVEQVWVFWKLLADIVSSLLAFTSSNLISIFLSPSQSLPSITLNVFEWHLTRTIFQFSSPVAKMWIASLCTFDEVGLNYFSLYSRIYVKFVLTQKKESPLDVDYRKYNQVTQFIYNELHFMCVIFYHPPFMSYKNQHDSIDILYITKHECDSNRPKSFIYESSVFLRWYMSIQK